MRELFDKLEDGREVHCFKMSNAKGVSVTVLDYGAILHSVKVPDKEGVVADVTLSSPDAKAYVEDTNFFGSTVGPHANRVANAECDIDGVKYHMVKNDGENNLHSDIPNGLNKRMWQATEGNNSVTFSLNLPDGEFGLPGNRELQVTYSLSEDSELKIEYNVTSDKNTMINMTNHSYFNLAGHNSGSVLDHELQIKASSMTAIRAGAIPTGETPDIRGTVLDFCDYRVVGKDIASDNEQISLVNGYDFNYIVDDYDGSIKEIATLKDPKSGRMMKVYTDLPGVQLYTANWVENAPGKEGMTYQQRYGLCLETQFYPDSIHHDNFCDVVFGPDREYHSTTIYKFE